MARDYTKIEAWELADELALLVYKATKDFPKSEVWGLTSQMRRVAVYRKVWSLSAAFKAAYLAGESPAPGIAYLPG